MKTKNNNIRFTKRQLELIYYACELSQDGRNYKDQVGLSAIVEKLSKAGVINDTTINNCTNNNKKWKIYK